MTFKTPTTTEESTGFFRRLPSQLIFYLTATQSEKGKLIEEILAGILCTYLAW